MSDTMRAMLLDRFGEALVERRLARPVPAAGEVLVRVAASSVNPLDIKIREGVAGHAQVRPPFVLGIDLAGVVEGRGDGAERFAIGDRVFGMTGGVGNRQGSLAEYAAVDQRLLAKAPERLPLREAAALPLAAITAWEGLIDRAGVQEGDLVLVHGGAGGVGSVAVQLALSRGARVSATAGPAGSAYVESIGAAPIDRGTPIVDVVAAATGGVGFDVVFDTVGGAVLDDSFAAVRRYTGHVVSILGWGVHSLAPLSFRGATYSGVFTLLPLLTGEAVEHHGEILEAVAQLVDSGWIAPRVAPEHFDLSAVNAAHRLTAAGGAGGRVVVDIAGDA